MRSGGGEVGWNLGENGAVMMMMMMMMMGNGKRRERDRVNRSYQDGRKRKK